ncbi:MAG: transposase [Candidatus Electrothrix sp. YB6]
MAPEFHMLKIINETVDQVRREETKNNPLAKGTRYIFLKNDGGNSGEGFSDGRGVSRNAPELSY